MNEPDTHGGTVKQIDRKQEQLDNGLWYWKDSYGYRTVLKAERDRLQAEVEWLREELNEARTLAQWMHSNRPWSGLAERQYIEANPWVTDVE